MTPIICVRQDAGEELSALDVVFYATLEVSHLSWIIPFLLPEQLYSSSPSDLRWETLWVWLRMVRMRKEEGTAALCPDCGGRSWRSERGATPEQSWAPCGRCCSRRSTPSSGRDKQTCGGRSPQPLVISEGLVVLKQVQTSCFQGVFYDISFSARLYITRSKVTTNGGKCGLFKCFKWKQMGFIFQSRVTV